MFNRFEPLQEGDVKRAVESLLNRCGFSSQGLFVMDGSKRSAHGNAYFTGMGKSKRIVFFDTLFDENATCHVAFGNGLPMAVEGADGLAPDELLALGVNVAPVHTDFMIGGPEVDAELIVMAHALWQSLGLSDVRLELNSLGQPEERNRHRAALIAYFEAHADQLDEDAKRRLHSNPLRILDTKNPSMQALVEGAPKLMDHLGESSRAHFDQVCAILTQLGLSFRINPRLVRGMDYYNLTVFEFVTQSLGSQGTICGGGRYDYLIEQIGGKPAPAVGWALGVERVLELLKEQDLLPTATYADVYAIVPDASAMPVVFEAINRLRSQGVSVQMHAGSGESFGSMKSQFKKADASGARFALIFGADELARQEVTWKSLRDGQGQQETTPINTLASFVVKRVAEGARLQSA